jgi:WD40 repeat protein
LVLLAACLGEAPGQEKSGARVDFYGDPLPPGALARLGSTRWRLEDRNATVAFTAAGRALLASSGSDGTVTLWDVTPRKKLGTFNARTEKGDGNGFGPRSVFSADAKTLFVRNGADLTAWDVATGRKRSFEVKENELLTQVAVASRGARVAGAHVRDVAVGWQVEAVSVWDAATGKGVRRIPTAAFSPWVRAAAVSPDGKRLACGGNDGALWIVDADRGTKLHQLTVPEESISCLAFAPDGGTLVSGSFQGFLHEWDPVTGKDRRRWTAHPQGVAAVTFAPDGKTLASVGRGGLLVLWEPGSGKEVRKLSQSVAGAEALLFSPDGKSLAVSGAGFPLQVLDAATGQETLSLPAHRSDVLCLAYSPDSKTLATAGREATVRLWEPRTGKPLAPLDGGAGTVTELWFPPGGDSLLAAAEGPANVRRWDLRSRQVSVLGKALEDAQAVPLALVGDGQAVWWASRQQGEVLLQDLRSGVKARTLERAAGNEQPWAVAHDGKTLAASINGSTVFLWDGTTGQRHTPGWVFEGRVVGLAFAPDGRFLAVAGEGEQSLIHFCELATGKNRGQPIVCPERVTRIVFAPDGRTLAAITADRGVRVWDVETRQERSSFKGHDADIRCVAIAPDGRTLTTGSTDATALVWDLTGGITGTGVALPSLWAELASSSAEKAHRAVWGIVGHGDNAAEFVRERVKPVTAVSPEALARRVADVGSERFSVRERAFTELERVGTLAGPAVKVALEKPLPLEIRRRLEKLLQGTASVELLRELRAVEVLERLGTEEARQVLRGLAGGAPEVRLTREAKGALRRLGNK